MSNNTKDDKSFTNSNFLPEIIVNDLNKRTKVLTTLEEELSKCDEFLFSVAFVTDSGVVCIKNKLKELEKKGIQGTIIASGYQNFTSPKALRSLLRFKNIKLKMILEPDVMHTKGYIFRKKGEYSTIIGSSNLTQKALGSNLEWNLKINSKEDEKIIKDILGEYKRLSDMALDVTEEFLIVYETMYNKLKAINKMVEREFTSLNKLDDRINKIKPNIMQIEALDKIKAVRDEGKNKTLVISATGTGKTFLSAFDVREFNPKKFLFVVHRETIAKAALKTYKRVIGYNKTMAILSGSNKDFNANYLFATIQTLSKEEIYTKFKIDEFDYIVIDEVHRAGSESYKKIFNYFKPKFILGMSATPERTDDFDIFKLFDYSVAYEIRLAKAMEEDLIAPFHYFGVSEISVDDKVLSETTDFRFLTSDERIKHITEVAEFYGYSGNRVRGIIFCSRKEEAKELSSKFNKLGYKTTFLSGASLQDEREKAIQMLEAEDRKDGLDYIFTVDIFNEGVDIPSVNQVLMLRPTKSAIVFVQQLGRGLRKYEGKEYVNVIDFIGNYDTNFLIPIALSGDKSYNKDNLRKYLFEGNSVIPGCSTVNFDSIAKDMIFKNIDKTSFNMTQYIKDSYRNLKQRLGRIPSVMDFEENDTIDVLRIFEKFESYHEFLKKYEPDYNKNFSQLEELYMKFISSKLADGKKLHELVIVNLLLKNPDENILPMYVKIMLSEFNIVLCKNSLICSKNILTGDHLTGLAKKKYTSIAFIENDIDSFIIGSEFKKMLKNDMFEQSIRELIDFGLHRNKLYYSDRYSDTNLVLNKKYTYEDVCKLLNWHKSEVALNIGGYKHDETTNTFPVFINYHKDESINNTIKYEDRFISPSILKAMSKSGRDKNSKDIKTIYDQRNNNLVIHLFVRKNKDDNDSKEFYYLGKLSSGGEPLEMTMPNTNKKVVEITYHLDESVENNLYEYITN